MFLVEEQARSTLERVLLETTVQCTLSGGETFNGYSSDLSVGGLYLKSSSVLDVNALLKISFSLNIRGQEIPFACRARVAWRNYEEERLKLDYPPGVGLQFLELPEQHCSMLSTFIDHYDESKKMNMVCAWCGKHLGMRIGPDGRTSHGICGQCKENHF